MRTVLINLSKPEWRYWDAGLSNVQIVKLGELEPLSLKYREDGVRCDYYCGLGEWRDEPRPKAMIKWLHLPKNQKLRLKCEPL